ncbi:hypothetical protein [Devosia sp. CAU 1758]
MRKFIAALGVAGVMGLSAVSSPFAAPVPGFEALYQAVFAACTPSGGVAPSPAACEAAINAYSAALIAAGVDPAVALQSFTELRAEVAAAGGGDVIEALFEELLPESGAVAAASPV